MCMQRIFLLLIIAVIAMPAYADPIDDISNAIFERNSETVKIKPEFRKCLSDAECTSELVLCRWRATNTASQKYVKEVASKVTLPCIWPPPPEQPQYVRCKSQLCDIPSDGKHY